jgi:hypothetical protein
LARFGWWGLAEPEEFGVRGGEGLFECLVLCFEFDDFALVSLLLDAELIAQRGDDGGLGGRFGR